MLSAFSHGNLKKDPLAGTSLDIDPNRSEMRTNYLDLFNEAKASGQGREGMLATLASRHKGWGDQFRPRLDEINKEVDATQLEAKGYQDSDKEAKMNLRAATAAAYLKEQANIKNNPKKVHNKHAKDFRLNEEFKGEIDSAWANAAVDDPLKLASGGDKTRYTHDYLNKIMTDYEGYTIGNQANLAKFNADKYQPLLVEQKKMRQTLQDKADLYNSFLGMGF